MGRRQRDSAFIGVSDEEVRGLARDATAPKDLRRRAQAEEKNRKLRNIQGRKDCGEHEWYKSTEDWDACYHCEAGGRPHALIEGGVSQGTEELMREAGLGHLLDGERDRPRAPT